MNMISLPGRESLRLVQKLRLAGVILLEGCYCEHDITARKRESQVSATGVILLEGCYCEHDITASNREF